MSRNHKRFQRLSLSVSQNFLTSTATIRKILMLSSIGKDDSVIEIGAGKGHITKQLTAICHDVTAYEIDLKLHGYLQEKLGDRNNLILAHQDFLKAELPKNKDYKVFSNIPFSITSNIIKKLTGNHPPCEAWIIMEKGAAKRFIGKPGDTLASLCLKPFFDMEIQYHFLRQDFHPMPSVDIVLLHLAKKKQSDIPFSQKESFAEFIEKSRKYGVAALLTKKQIKTALKLSGLPCIKETGDILYIQWLCLFRCFVKFKAK